MDNEYIGGSIGNYHKRTFKSKMDKTLWDNIYAKLSKYGGFHNQSDATDELFQMHNKVIKRIKVTLKEIEND